MLRWPKRHRGENTGLTYANQGETFTLAFPGIGGEEYREPTRAVDVNVAGPRLPNSMLKRLSLVVGPLFELQSKTNGASLGPRG